MAKVPDEQYRRVLTHASGCGNNIKRTAIDWLHGDNATLTLFEGVITTEQSHWRPSIGEVQLARVRVW